MPISKELLAERSRSLRLEVHRLMEGGVSEAEALKTALPQDTNRSRKMRTWKNSGLFPVPAEELEEISSNNSSAGGALLEPPPEDTPHPEPTLTVLPETALLEGDATEPEETERMEEPYESEPEQSEALPEETVVSGRIVLESSATTLEQQALFTLIDQRVEKAVQGRLEAMAGDVTVTTRHPGGAGRGNKGSRVKKFNVSVPTELYERLDALGGIKSQHVSHAIRLYLDFLKK